MMNESTAPRSRRRLLRVVIPALLAIPVLAVLALPWALNSRPGRHWLLARASRALAPGALRIDSLRFSWFGPTRMTRLVLFSAQGERVVAAPVATWDRNLFQVLFERPRLGTLRLDRAEIDVERAPDGTVDLYETLRPVINGDPMTALKIEVRDGRLRARGKGLAEPVSAGHAEIMVVIAAEPGPISWRARLANGNPSAPGSALAIDGRFDRKSGAGDGDLETLVSARAWPLTLGDSKRGTLSARLDGGLRVGRKDGLWTLTGDLALVQIDLAGASRLGLAGERLALKIKASAPGGGERIDLVGLGVESRFGRLDASGRIEGPAGKPIADLNGTIRPDWDVINRWLAENIEPGARVSGRDRPFHLHAAMGGAWRETLVGEIGLALDSADVYGMAFGPVAVDLRAREGAFTIAPIETTINGGRLMLKPEIQLASNVEPAAIVLGKGSALTDVTVNDEVSRRVLSFVAPVLDSATRVRGRVSATIERAVFPMVGGPTVDGEVVFQDVEFVPGPLLDDLFDLLGDENSSEPSLKLNQPVALKIADRRVYQSGLAIPIGNLSKIELEGWVGFDRTLNLTASVPLLTNQQAERPVLGAIAGEERIRVPIRGTLRKPEIDRGAFNLGMKELGRSLLERGAVTGAAGLLERMLRPRDPNAPPPPTAEERRARRQERRAERKQRREKSPVD